MKKLWSELEAVDPTLEYGGLFRKDDLDKFQTLVTFMEHCCQTRHYSFTIKKCGEPSRTLCKPVRAPRESFDMLNFLPDPIPSKDGHYCPFTEVYGLPQSGTGHLFKHASKRLSLLLPACNMLTRWSIAKNVKCSV